MQYWVDQATVVTAKSTLSRFCVQSALGCNFYNHTIFNIFVFAFLSDAFNFCTPQLQRLLVQHFLTSNSNRPNNASSTLQILFQMHIFNSKNAQKLQSPSTTHHFSHTNTACHFQNLG